MHSPLRSPPWSPRPVCASSVRRPACRPCLASAIAVLFLAVGLCAPAAGADRDPHHHRAGEPPTGRVILPGAGAALDEAMSAISGQIPRFDAHLHRLAATGKVCTRQSCWDFQLTDPTRACHGAKLPAFCLTWRGHVPPPAVAVPVTTALQGVDPAVVWSEAPDAPAPPAQRLGLAAALLMLPVLLGFALGRGGRRLLPDHPGIRSLLALLLAVGLGWWGMQLALADRAHPAPADVLLSAALLYFGAWLGGLRLRDPRVVRLTVIGGMLGLVGAEIALQKSLHEPPTCWHGGEIKLLHPATRERICRGAFPLPRRDYFDRIARGTSGREVYVLHLGDSMVFGSGVAENETFVSLLDRRDPRRRHVNASSPDIGPDHLLLTLRRWHAAGRRTARVVWYVYTGNDLVDLDRPSPCCGGEPLLTYPRRGVPTGRCNELRWHPDAALAILKSAPPYALQVLSQHLTVASVACAAMPPATSAIGRITGLLPADADGAPQALPHLRAILAAAAAVGPPLEVVLLPERDGLEAADPENSPARARGRRVVEICKALGIRVHDAWELLHRAIRREGAAPFFARTHARDYHLSARGHLLVADWLEPLLFGDAPGQPTESAIEAP